jgi:hypothetical protein
VLDERSHRVLDQSPTAVLDEGSARPDAVDVNNTASPSGSSCGAETCSPAAAWMAIGGVPPLAATRMIPRGLPERDSAVSRPTGAE